MVPNVIHFIWITGENSRPFSYFNYMAVRAAKERTGAAVVIHCNEPPRGNRHWDMAMMYCIYRRVNVPTHIGDTEIKHVQYASDVIRLQLLYRWGGIYIDTDMILTKQLTQLMDKPLTMVIESVDEHENPKSVANGVILAKPKSEFLKLMLDATPIAMKSDIWANHAVTLPLELSKAYPDLIHLEPKEAFFPFDLARNYPFEEGKGDEYMPLMNKSYGLHIYETFWQRQLQNINEDTLKSSGCLFGKLFF